MRLRYSGPFFHEFVVDSDRPAAQIDEALREMGIVGGLPLDAHGILYCVTEMNTRREIDALVRGLEVIA